MKKINYKKIIFYNILIFIFSSQLFSQNKLTIDDIFGAPKFKMKSLSAPNWMNDGERYTFMEFNAETKSSDLFLYNVKSKKKELFLTSKDLIDPITKSPLSFMSFQYTPDETQMLLTSSPPERQYLSRLTPSGNFYLYNLKSKNITQLTNATEPQYNQKFSPNGKYFGYVRENNIFVFDINSAKENQITNDGNFNIINGRFDWVYEEEFGISDGWKWSPNNDKIAFWRLDQTNVKEFVFTEWDSTYLNLVKMKYPKAGEENSLVKIGVYDLNSKKTKWIDIGNETDIYIPRIYWTKIPNILAILRLNREQNNLEILFSNVETGITEVVMNESAKNWLDIHDHFYFLENGNFIFSSERDNYLHFYLYDYKTKTAKQITKGNWEVESLYGVDEEKEILYFSSSEISALERQIYSIKFSGKNKKQLTTESGTHSAKFSPNHKYFLNYYSNSYLPNQVYLKQNDGKRLEVLVDNSMEIFKGYNLSKTEFLKFQTSDSVELNASIMKPVDFDPNKKYPVLVSTYGGPGSQVVRNAWGGNRNQLWNTLLTEKGYIIFMVDNRGTGARGRDFRQITYKNLGEWEIKDQIEGAKYLSNLNFVDANRIGIWGWSYGGYMASLAITKGADYFKTAIAVAPVTHWKLYDNIYTERFMSTPQKNPDGYEKSSPITYVKNFKGKFLLIHGASDDNVHFQNSAQLATALQKNAMQFETMFYPNKNHGIYGGKTSLHLYNLMTEFILKNL